jgi:hypothetical protein
LDAGPERGVDLMPQVPYSGVPDVSAQSIDTPLLRVNAGPATFGGTIAQAIEHLGTTSEKVGGELFDRAVAMQQLRNEAERTQAMADYEQQSNDLYIKFQDKQGKNAIDGWDGYKEEQNKLRQSIRDGMSNDMTRKMFDAQSLSLMNRQLVYGAHHMAAENKKYLSNAANARISSLQDSARYAKEDYEFEENLDGIANEVKSDPAYFGDSEDQIRGIIFKNQSKAWAERIIETAKTDPFRGQDMFDKAVENRVLHSQDWDRARDIVRREMMSSGTRSIGQRVFRDVNDPEGFLQRRAPGVRVEGINPTFATRLHDALAAAEIANPGERAQIESLTRTAAEQARIRAEHEAMPGGVAAHPAALPGTSRHEFGEAADIKEGKVLDWLHQHAGEYGLEFLKGKTGVNDPGHIQLSGVSPTRTAPTYEVSETQLADRARAAARAERPRDIEFEEAAVRHVIGTYHQNRDIEKNAQNSYIQKIDESWNTAGVPHTINELMERSPEVRSAVEALNPSLRKKLEKEIFVANKQGAAKSDEDEVKRLTGMSTDPSQFSDYLNENIYGNKKLVLKDQLKFFKLQQRIKNNAEADPRVSLAMNSIALPDEIRDDRDRRNMFRGALQEMMNQYQAVHKTTPKGQDLQDIAQRLLAYNKAPSGSILDMLRFNRQQLFEMSVPDIDAQRIKNDPLWGRRKLPPPSDEQIRRIYIRQQYKQLFEKETKQSSTSGGEFSTESYAGMIRQ